MVAKLDSVISQAMIRFLSMILVALSCTFGAVAARAQGSSDSDLVTRLDRLEQTIRDLTGQVEQLQYHNQQLEQQVQRLQALVQGGAPTASASPRPPQYSAPPAYAPPPQYSPPPSVAQYSPPPQYPPPPPAPSYPPAPIAAGAGAPDSGHHDAFNPALDPSAPGAPRPLGTSTTATEPPPSYQGPPADGSIPRQAGAPLSLSGSPAAQAGAAPDGTLPPPPPSNPSATGGMQASLSPTMPPANTPKDVFELGRGYFERKDYARSADTFRDFVQQYPRDRLTGEAQYWLGQSLFATGQYHDAAEAFLAVSTKYDTSAHAPDALVRLGESLAALGQKEAACASLGEVLRKYPRASLSVKQSVAREQKRVHC
jgi:tol-pal system protein YbgF